MTTIILIGGYLPSRHEIFSYTSKVGEVVLLVAVTFLVYLVQEDLLLAGSFADYLHKSNIAFSTLFLHKVNLTMWTRTRDLCTIDKLVKDDDEENSKENRL